MKKSSIILITVIVLISLGVYFYYASGMTYEECIQDISQKKKEAGSDNDLSYEICDKYHLMAGKCAGQGEKANYDESTPLKCCGGLGNVATSDSISIVDKCYWVGTESGIWWNLCSDCGNGICEDVESVCGCPEDCIGKEKSTFNTIQDFCDNGYNQYCGGLPEGMELELCKLC